jgi:hypothetical protein
MLLGTFRIGEDIAIALDAVSGNASSVTVQAWIVRSMERSLFRPESSFTPIAMTVAPRAASGDFPAGWNISMAAAQSADLSEGFYGIDAKLTGAGGTIDITDSTALIALTKAAVA